MLKKIILVIIIFFTVYILTMSCKGRNNNFGHSTEKSQSANFIPADCAITSPIVHQEFLPVEHLAVDTAIVKYTSSDIAYSGFVAIFLDTISSTVFYTNIVFHEYYINISKDSLSYYYISQMRSIPDVSGHASPSSITLFVEESAYKIQDNIIYVHDYQIQILNDEQLKVKNLPEIQSGTIFYCTRRHYDNKKLKYRGAWEDGKKHGEWTYIDEEGKIFRVVYEHGNLIKMEEGRSRGRLDVLDTQIFR